MDAHEALIRSSPDGLLQYVLAHANCLLWHATVRRRADDPGQFDWEIEVFDEAAAQRFLPLEMRPGERYMEALQRGKPAEESRRMDRASRHALDSGARHYRQDFACRGRDGKIHWLHEEVHLE